MTGIDDVKFFKPFIEGTLNTIQIQCSTKATSEKPFAKGQSVTPEIAIAGVISLDTNAFTGTIALGFPQEVFLGLIGNMLGEKFPEITSDLEDGAAEFLNIIFGFAKRIWTDNGYTVTRAIPTVVRGQNLVVSPKSKGINIIMPFKTEFGVFYIEIASEAAKS